MGTKYYKHYIMNILITGGLGFIGINTALKYVNNPDNQIIILDNLSKKGSKNNIKLLENHKNVTLYLGDITDQKILNNIFNSPIDVVIHLAAQTAVTTSVTNPTLDFNSNALGTFILLETIRQKSPNTHILYASTNKVYGDLNHIPLIESKTRYKFEEKIIGVDENTHLDLYSPYGCSKGAADQYVLDYARIYGLKTTCLRQSCIYGPYQNGTEDQGWVAWFMKAFLSNQNITIYGNGKQVRDALYVDDLVNLYDHIIQNQITGVFNVGGGITNSISLIETIEWMEKNINSKSKILYDVTRPGDQMIFISDNTKLKNIGWKPKTKLEQGFNLLLKYLK